MLNESTIRDYAARAGRVINTAQQRPTLLGRFVAHLIVLFFLLLVLVIAIPLIALLMVCGLLVWGYAKVRGIFSRAQDPNGLLDGRRNVRVVTHRSRTAAAAAGEEEPSA